MKHTIIKLVILVTCAISFCTQQVQAVPITIEITGNVTSVTGSGAPDSIDIRSVFTGTYTYDTSTADSHSSPRWGDYRHDSGYGFEIFLGGLEFETVSTHVGGFGIDLWDDVLGGHDNLYDKYNVYSSRNSRLPNGDSYLILWRLDDDTHTALSSDALPVTAPVLSDWTRNSFVINYPNTWSIGGVVTEAVLIPEPFTAILMVVGVFFVRRR